MRTFSVLVTACVGCLVCSAAFGEVPAVFSGMTYKEARAATKESGKLLLVDATAVWCGPCKQMDKTTWVDENVVAWINEHAVAIQIDVDRKNILSRHLKIEAMPTIIVFREGELFDRAVGYKTADELLGWLGDVQNGERAIDRMVREAGDRVGEDGSVDLQSRYRLAQQWQQSENYTQATEEYAWIWSHCDDYPGQGMGGVRGSYMASDMQRLAEVHQPAWDTFAELRDEVGDRVAAGARDLDNLGDWVTLNEVLGEDQKTLEWFDQEKEQGGPAAFRWVDHRLKRLLIEQGRWADLPIVCADPLAEVRGAASMRRRGMEFAEDERFADRKEEIVEAHDRMFREGVSQLYAGYLAAGLDRDAAQIATEILKADDTPAMRLVLVDTALRVGEAREVFYELLGAAEEEGEAVGARREKVERMLAEVGDE